MLSVTRVVHGETEYVWGRETDFCLAVAHLIKAVDEKGIPGYNLYKALFRLISNILIDYQTYY